MAKELSKQYDPQQVEGRIYQFWLDGGYFHAVPNPDKSPYTIIMPPPNITGQLHMGHALDNTLQDILTRWRRMQGYEALWMPGTDHASIATEVKIVEAMREEGLTKDDIGREAFLERAWQWRETYGNRITSQLRRLGSSCDWERERFTMDESSSRAVVEAFNRLYEKGLIYRGERIINWCPDCLTSISDAEVEHEEQDGHFWHIRYPITDGSGYVEIATTRPETLLGDTAVAVHPDDERYKNLVGKTVTLPLMEREIPVVADSYVEMDFGTGVVKITPAHDPNDFEVGLRHSLPIINVMNEDASINKNGGKYEGMTREQARKAVVADLEAQGLLVKVEDHVHNVGTCYRCHTTVEPRVSMQWFVEMDPLAKPAIEAVRSGETKFVPDRFEKIYYNWMDNIRDWCISRQLWWGHRIPAWHCDDCGEITVSRETVTVCPKCGGTVHQDPDTLDTWFSSALWPFSTLGWPDKTPELDYFYPTDTLVTAYDIIFFWVARMIFSGIEQMGETPFHTVFMHGLIRDAQNRKMSKSLGNGIDPIDLMDNYGADALRFMLATGVSPGNDMRFMEEKVLASRNFANKIWNAVRYVLMNLEGADIQPSSLPEELAIEDKWVLGIYNNLVAEVTSNLEKFELGIAAQKLYDFIWDIFCDWYIEITKTRIQQGGDTALRAQQVLVYVLEGTLRLLHPFMPFLTEELWQALPHEGESLMVQSWPVAIESLSFDKEQEDFSIVLDAIRAIRARRSEMNVPPSKKASVYIETDLGGVFAQGVPFIQRLAFADQVEVGTSFQIDGAVQVVTDSARILIPMDQLVDMEKERQRLEKEKADALREIEIFEKKLSNESFVSKAPAAVVEAEREKLAKAKERLGMIGESLASM
ncbi:MAG: valine--tRNA ligase [Oscillospiraceae bacterium]